MTQIHSQLKTMWMHVGSHARNYGYKQDRALRRELINNNVWLNALPIMDFLKMLGRGVRLGTMLGRDT